MTTYMVKVLNRDNLIECRDRFYTELLNEKLCFLYNKVSSNEHFFLVYKTDKGGKMDVKSFYIFSSYSLNYISDSQLLLNNIDQAIKVIHDWRI